MPKVRSSVLVFLAGWCLLPLPLLAQAPAGPEFTVTPASERFTGLGGIAQTPDRTFAITWEWGDVNPERGGISAQRFDARGGRRGAELQMSPFPPAVGHYPRAVADANGLTILWADEAAPFTNARGRRFNPNGVLVGLEFRVNTYTTAQLEPPRLATNGAGEFVAVWSSFHDGGHDGILGQRFDSLGARRGAEFTVTTSATGYAQRPEVAMDAAGNFVVVWDVHHPSGGYDIVGQRFAAGGSPQGAPFDVTTDTNGRAPVLAGSPQGEFVVAWGLPPTGVARLMGRKYAADGTAVTPILVLDDARPGFLVSAVALDGAGRFAVAWADANPDPASRDVRLRRFAADGTPRGPSVAANASDSLRHGFPALVSDPQGRFVAAWNSGDDEGTFAKIDARRFGLLGVTTLAVDTAPTASSDGNRVLEPGETVDFRPAWRNESNAALALGGTLALGGPSPATYTVPDPSGSYGTLASGQAAACSDCYTIGVQATQRPAVHWDAVGTETTTSTEEGEYPWSVHVGGSFTDVQRTDSYYRFVETILHRGVTAGCAVAAYCPTAAVTRAQMAVFVLKAKEPAVQPLACAAGPRLFLDVPASSPFCRFIEELAHRAVTGGCGGGNFCPDDAVTREQMAVFVLRTLDPALSPPACTTPMFADVPASSPFCRWVEEMARRGITGGCGGGNYCPGQPVTRGQMAVFLTTTFGLTLYGP